MKKFVVCALLVVLILSAVACTKTEYTETVAFDKKDAKTIAHRGLSGLAVENTDTAFILAGQHSYYGIESDVRRTKDGQFVMCHDDNLNRIAGIDMSVENSTLEELLNVPLLPKNENSQVEHLSTLESYILICKQYDKQAILELKSNFTEQEIVQMIAIITGLGYIHRVTFISFGYDNLTYVRKYLPNQSVMFLFSALTDEITTKLIADKIDVAINHKELTKKALEQFHDAGLKVNCWTVDDKAKAERLVKMGVDYITTNILE